MTNEEITKAFIAHLNSLKPVTVDKIPNIDLYMDQVTTFMDTYLADTRRYESDKVLTKTMINNYAKNHLLPPPVNKKYSQEHMIFLIFIYYLKSFLSIGDIQEMLTPLLDSYAEESDPLNIAEVYTSIFANYPEEGYRLMKDVAHKLNIASESFQELEGKQKDDMQKFTYLCLLGFDIYMKKHLMESLIDEMAAEHAPAKKKK